MPLYTLAKDSTQDPTKEQTIEILQDPPYMQLWEKIKKYKDGKWDPEAEVKYKEFKKLHEDLIQKHGFNNLSLKEAYVEVLKEKPGYHRGLGPGLVPPRKGRNGGESNQIRVELTAQLQQLQQKEVALQVELGRRKVANLELKTNIEHMQKEAVERENKWKQ